jgi:hypothetical protein
MAVWVARGSYGNLRGTGFLNLRTDFFGFSLSLSAAADSLRLGGFARQLFFFPLAKAQSRKEIVSTSRFSFLVSCFLLLLIGCRRPLRLPYFAACPAELRGAILFFLLYSRKACPPRRTGAKTCPPRWAQRNCGSLGLTSGGLGFFAACPAEIRVRRGGREPASRGWFKSRHRNIKIKDLR